ncbi:hypothetical protein ABZY03_33845, partial [Streptomyces klenkii]
MTARRGKKRQFNFAAVEHVGNDADEGGFLGNEEAEQERQSATPANEPHLPSPAAEPTPPASASASPAMNGEPGANPEPDHVLQEHSASALPSPAVEPAGPQPDVAPLNPAAPADAAGPVQAQETSSKPATTPPLSASPVDVEETEPAPSPQKAEPPRHAVRLPGRVYDG